MHCTTEHLAGVAQQEWGTQVAETVNARAQRSAGHLRRGASVALEQVHEAVAVCLGRVQGDHHLCWRAFCIGEQCWHLWRVQVRRALDTATAAG